jgi:hypothetical protein
MSTYTGPFWYVKFGYQARRWGVPATGDIGGNRFLFVRPDGTRFMNEDS